jgi:hypothetical protein
MDPRARPPSVTLLLSRCSTLHRSLQRNPPSGEIESSAHPCWQRTHKLLRFRSDYLYRPLSVTLLRCAPDFRPQGVGPPGRQLRTTSKSSRVPPTAHYERYQHRLRTIVAAQHSASPTQPTRIETHACQEWSMTDLNSSTNQPKSRCILLDSPCWPPIKTHRTNPSAKLDARRMLHRTDWPGPTFGSSPAENPPPGVADRDE